MALTKLIADGRIHPARIEEVVAKARQEVDLASARQASAPPSTRALHGLHPDLVKLMGRLKFRTSYGQNVLNHSRRGLDPRRRDGGRDRRRRLCRQEGGLLHDIGKAVDHEIEGPHALIGADICKRLGKSAQSSMPSPRTTTTEPQTVEAFIVAAGDAISGGAARRPPRDGQHLHQAAGGAGEIANCFPGVERSFAIQAGRELRIAVKPDEVDDLTAMRVARDVAKQIEENLEYPGQIKVMVIREKRVVDYAR